MTWGYVAVGVGTAELKMFREGQEATAPWREVGEQALGSLAGAYGLEGISKRDEYGDVIEGEYVAASEDPYAGYMESPGYQYELAESEKAAKRALSSKGFSGSGAEMKELQRIAQGEAQQGYGDYLSGLRSMAGLGQTSAGQTAAQSASVGSDISAQYAAQGAANAQSQINQANTWGSTISQGAQLYGMYQGQQQQQPAYGNYNNQMTGSPTQMQTNYSYA